MIEKLFNNAHIMHQTVDEKDEMPEQPITGSVDNGDMIILSQEGRNIMVNRSSVPDLCKMLKKLAAEGRGKA